MDQIYSQHDKPRKFWNIALIGFMGCGKTTVGRKVAQRLHYQFIDTDHLIETRLGMKIPQIFEKYGEAFFRNIEAEVVKELSVIRRAVIATGGGMGANPHHLASLKQHSLVICLWATPEVLYERLKKSSDRPLLYVSNPKARIEELLKDRMPVYRQADVIMNTGLRSIEELVRQVIHHYKISIRWLKCPQKRKI